MFTELVEQLGVEDVEINDLYSIDTESLQDLDPLYGVIFLFKYGEVDRASASKPLVGVYDADYQDRGIFFANQTIQNACATQAVINILLNKNDLIDIGSELGNFKSFVEGFDSVMVGDTVSNSDLIRRIHNSFSAPLSLLIDEDKDAKRPDSKDDGVFHFVGYLQKDGFIYELDGLKTYPIKHVECTPEEFYLKLPQVIQSRISKYDASELRFSLLGITNNKLKHYSEIGDEQRVTQEILKRENWHTENEYRKHDYTGLVVELLKNISKNSTDEEWKALKAKAGERTALKLKASY